VTATDLPVDAGGGAASGTRVGRALGALTPSGRASVPLSWALYDFANTIYSYAVVSYAIGLWAVDRLGRSASSSGCTGSPGSSAR
jgi:hypothetical protein